MEEGAVFQLSRITFIWELGWGTDANN